MLTLQRGSIQANPYHLVQPSPWPITTSFSLLLFALNLVIYMHNYTSLIHLLYGIALVVISIVLWMRDVVAEGTYNGDHTFLVQKGLSLGFALFVVSELIVFFGVFWAYFHSALSPTVELGSSWPPIGIDPLSPFEIPLFNTFLLLSSGATVTYAHHALIAGNRNNAIIGTLLTVVLAILFTAMQVIEYTNAPFTITDSVYGSVFYASTGIHSLHVIVGNLMIIVSLSRMISYHLTKTHHIGFETSIIYWHFVDVVWLFLYISVYWWGS